MQKGTMIAGRFQLLAAAAKGAMGVVYRALDTTTNETVALKLLALDRPLDITRFAREAALLATVQHPNIVNYVAHGEDNGVHYLATDWVDGVTLASQLRHHGTTIAEVLAIAKGVASALAATHALGVIHRDIKPSNIILAGGSADHVKLVDFGVARRTIEAGVVTKLGVMVGTPSYMAPEQARGLVALEPATDVWALGCVIYEGLTGRVAFAGKTPMTIRAKVLIGAVVPIRDYCPEAPAELVTLVADMLVKNPAGRLADGAAVRARLDALHPVADDGPRRRVGSPEPATTVLPVPRRDEAACFVFVSPPDPDVEDSEHGADAVASIASRHAMAMHVFEDGSALLTANEFGKPGAVDAARAALELRGQVADGAVTVFGQSLTDTLDMALDRGAALLERAMMSTLFGAAADLGEPVIHLDHVIAELIAGEFAVVSTDQGPVLRASMAPRATG